MVSVSTDMPGTLVRGSIALIALLAACDAVKIPQRVELVPEDEVETPVPMSGLLFRRHVAGAPQLFFDDGDTEIAITEDAWVTSHAWLPDIQRVAYAAWRTPDGGVDLRTVATDGSDDQLFFSWEQLTGWLHDGSGLDGLAQGPRGALSFHAIDLWVPSVHLLPLDGSGGGETLVESGRDPAWSPGTDEVVYAASSGLMKAVPPSATPEMFVQMPSTSQPAWSNHGDWLVFCGGTDTRDLYLVRSDGTELAQLTSLPGDETDPQFSADDTQILFTHRVEGAVEIRALTLANGELETVSFNAEAPQLVHEFNSVPK